MCAASGSKTAQIIEALHTSENGAGDVPAGVVVANDANRDRVYTLIHQLRRHQSPNILFTNHEAQFIPNIRTRNDQQQFSPLSFDRILCDVPCT